MITQISPEEEAKAREEKQAARGRQSPLSSHPTSTAVRQ